MWILWLCEIHKLWICETCDFNMWNLHLTEENINPRSVNGKGYLTQICLSRKVRSVFTKMHYFPTPCKMWFKKVNSKSTLRRKRRGKGVGKGKVREFGIDMYTLLYLKRITNKHRERCSVLCNNLNGKRIWKRINTCICTTESLCCTPETITTC